MINTILISVALSYSSAALSYLYDFCIGEPHGTSVNKGRIFSFIGVFIRSKFDNFEAETEKIRDNTKRSLIESGYEIGAAMEEADKFYRVNPWKAAGVCPICFNVWCSIIICVPSIFAFDIPWYLFLPITAVANRILRGWYNI